MKIDGLSIDFPEIEAVSDRQLWYANHLRNQFIEDNFCRFLDIDECLNVELDNRFRYEKGEYCESDFTETFGIHFSDCEMVCLFSSNAGVIISALKDRDW